MRAVPTKRAASSSAFESVWSFLRAVLGPTGLALAIGIAALVILGTILTAAWQASPRETGPKNDPGRSGEQLPPSAPVISEPELNPF